MPSSVVDATPALNTVSSWAAGLAPPATALNDCAVGLTPITGPGAIVAVTVSTYGLFDAPAEVRVTNAVSAPGARMEVSGLYVSPVPPPDASSHAVAPLVPRKVTL